MVLTSPDPLSILVQLKYTSCLPPHYIYFRVDVMKGSQGVNYWPQPEEKFSPQEHIFMNQRQDSLAPLLKSWKGVTNMLWNVIMKVKIQVDVQRAYCLEKNWVPNLDNVLPKMSQMEQYSHQTMLLSCLPNRTNILPTQTFTHAGSCSWLALLWHLYPHHP